MRTDEEIRRTSSPGELRSLPDDELARLLALSNATIVAGDVLDESRRRDAARFEATTRRLTWWIAGMTVVVAVMTVIVAVAAVVPLFRQ